MTLRNILFTSAAILTGLSVLPTIALAETSPPVPSISQTESLNEIRMHEAESGTLMFRTQTPGRYIQTPMVATDVKMDIAGPVIRTTLSQTFENTADEWVEGVYVFPLPENAAVDRLRMVIGGRTVSYTHLTLPTKRIV